MRIRNQTSRSWLPSILENNICDIYMYKNTYDVSYIYFLRENSKSAALTIIPQLYDLYIHLLQSRCLNASFTWGTEFL